MRTIQAIQFICFLQISLLIACGREVVGNFSDTSGNDVRSPVGDKERTNSKNSLMLEISKELSALSGVMNVGAVGQNLAGTCISAAKVELQGDVLPAQSTDCIEGQFKFPNFRLSDLDGLKSLFVTQTDSSGVVLSSERIEMLRNTKSLFKLTENTLFQKPTAGTIDDAIKDVISDGENLVLTLARGGLAISRDFGKTWQPKTIAHGLQSKTAHSVFSYNNVFYATSTDGFFTSVDFGRTWLRNELVDGMTGKVHLHQGQIFIDFGGKGAVYTKDDGSTWTETGDLPGTYPGRDWTSLGKSLFVTSSSDGVYQYSPEQNNWSAFRPAGLAADRRVVSIQVTEKLALAQVSFWPEKSGDPRSYLVSTDAGSTWRDVYSSSNRFEEVSILSDLVLRNTLFAKSFDVRVSRDSGQSWLPLALPSSMENQLPAHDFSFFHAVGSVILRSSDRFAMTTDSMLTEWRTFEIPTVLRKSKMLAYRDFQGRRFLIFDTGLLFSNASLDQWSMLLVQPPTGPIPSGIKVKGSTIFTWSQASSIFLPKGMGGLYMSRDGGSSFENITSRLKLLNGFYVKSDEMETQPGVTTMGYSVPVNDVELTDKKIFVSTPEGVAISSDKAASFSFLLLPDGRRITGVNDVDAEGRTVALATNSNGLIVSQDEGETWTHLTQAFGLPSNKIDQIVLSGTKISIRINQDIYLSGNAGADWEKLSFLQNLPDTRIQSVRLCGVLICVVTRRTEATPEGYGVDRSVFSISHDQGKTFSTLPYGAIDDGFHYENGEYFIASGAAVHIVSRDLSQTRVAVKLQTSVTGMSVSDGAVYLSTFAGIYAAGAPTPVTTAEIPQNARVSKNVTLNDCSRDCSAAGPNQNPITSASPTPAPVIRLSTSQCLFNPETGRCDYLVSWENVPAGSCLWVQEVSSSPRLWECPSTNELEKGDVLAKWFKAGTSYTVFIAREITAKTPEARVVEKVLVTDSPQPEITREPCTAFDQRGTCEVKITWKFAPKNSCLWSVHPLTGVTFLAACALPADPSGHSFNFEWMYYGYTNKFFLARQVQGNPNLPQTERFAAVDWYQPTESQSVLSKSDCAEVESNVFCNAQLSWEYIPLGGCLYFQGTEGPQIVVCGGTKGSAEIPWIVRGQESHFFMARHEDPSQKYAELKFTAPQVQLVPKISASPCAPNASNPILCTTTISWTNAPANSCVFVKTSTGAMTFACGGMNGSAVAPWVTTSNPGATVFLLADKTDPSVIYAEVSPAANQ